MSDFEAIATFKKLIAAAYDYEQTMKDHNVSQEQVDTLSEMLKSCDDVPRGIFDKILLVGLIACDNNLDKSVALVNNYCKYGKDSPEFFDNRDVDAVEFQAVMNNMYFAVLPPTPDNCNLVVGRLSGYEPKDYDFDQTTKTFMMLLGVYSLVASFMLVYSSLCIFRNLFLPSWTQERDGFSARYGRISLRTRFSGKLELCAETVQVRQRSVSVKNSRRSHHEHGFIPRRNHG
jgi:hypothetical protein